MMEGVDGEESINSEWWKLPLNAAQRTRDKEGFYPNGLCCGLYMMDGLWSDNVCDSSDH